jgi:lipopolysaccharide/colanic/teichoic acid biosynthesis glycosyltransferase
VQDLAAADRYLTMELSETRTSAAPPPLPFTSRPELAVRLDRAVARLLDLTVAGAVLLVLAPALMLIAILVRVSSPGPALFRQERLGRDRRPFALYKFRTMRADGGESLHRDYVRALITAPQAAEDGQLHKLTVDPRITRVGRVLRSWSLDELPQLINVLRGEMSLVGPRPVIDYEAELYPEAFLPRFSVRPGLTGLWQVSGRNSRTYQEMLDFDLVYAGRHSLRGDLAILWRTIPVVLGRRGVA